MSIRVSYSRTVLLILAPFLTIFAVLYLNTNTVTKLGDDTSTLTTNIPIEKSTVAFGSEVKLIGGKPLQDPADWKKRNSMLNTKYSGASIKPCETLQLADTRAFFEREPPQNNLPRSTSDKYRRNLRQQLKSLRIAVVGCAKNVEKNVDTFRENIEPIVDLFHPTSKIIIFESDSTDGTLEKLRSWKRAEILTYGNLSAHILRRTERLAVCRNELLTKAREIQSDYMFVVDIDIFAMNVTAFLSNFDWNPNEWSVMTGNLMKEYYYDIWALRTMSESIINYDCWHRVWGLILANNFCEDSVLENIIDIHRKPYPMERGLLEVRSAFGGSALYKMNVTDGCEYDGTELTCEHVPFHTCIRERNNGRIFINPYLTQ